MMVVLVSAHDGRGDRLTETMIMATKVTTMTRAHAKYIADDLQQLLAGWALERGLTVEVGGGSFDNLSFKPRVTFRVGETANGQSAEQAEFERDCMIVGLQPTDYGRTFGAYTVVGLNLRRPKKPVTLRHMDGRTFRTTVDHVLRSLKK